MIHKFLFSKENCGDVKKNMGGEEFCKQACLTGGLILKEANDKPSFSLFSFQSQTHMRLGVDDMTFETAQVKHRHRSCFFWVYFLRIRLSLRFSVFIVVLLLLLLLLLLFFLLTCT